MNTDRTPRLIAFALSLMVTLTLFSGVASLSSHEHAGHLLARAAAVQSANG